MQKYKNTKIQKIKIRILQNKQILTNAFKNKTNENTTNKKY